MSKMKFLGVAVLALMLGGASSVLGQKPLKDDKDKPSDDINNKQRNVKPELKDVYKKWINNDVAYIITKDEKRAFYALTTDEERENFIENFWRRRDPDPDTEENEYRDQYYERIAYANE